MSLGHHDCPPQTDRCFDYTTPRSERIFCMSCIKPVQVHGGVVTKTQDFAAGLTLRCGDVQTVLQSSLLTLVETASQFEWIYDLCLSKSCGKCPHLALWYTRFCERGIRRPVVRTVEFFNSRSIMKKGNHPLRKSKGEAAGADSRGLGADVEAMREQIQALAYHLWLERGCPIGSPEVDWLRAEEEMRDGHSRKKLPTGASAIRAKSATM